MKRLEITINNVAYPCRPSMGAMLRFAKETGKEVTAIDATSFTDLCTYLWCCIVSASKHEGLDFSLSLMDFADSIGPDDLTAWAKAIEQQHAADQETTEDEKKSL